MNINDFYLSFEEKHRGECALIKKRLDVYRPFLKELKFVISDPKVIDLGCGRGEWLELLEEYSFSSIGVDLDEGMLNVAKQKGLNVTLGDALDVLKNEKDNSLALVSGFHIVEHISFDKLLLLVQEALRTLKPGGLLILETPNPENIRVATTGFYMDPTHIRPIPSELLLFLVQESGFVRAMPLYLQEAKHLKNETDIQLLEVIGGVSPDYAIIGQKNGDTNLLDPFDTLFKLEYGINLETLANKFESRVASIQHINKMTQQEIEDIHILEKQKDKELKKFSERFESINLLFQQKDQEFIKLLNELENINSLLQQKDQELIKLSNEIESITSLIEQKDLERKEEISIFHNELMQMHRSLSWRITYPLRILNHWRKWFFLGVYSWVTFSKGSRPRRILKKFLAFLKRWIINYPVSYKIILKFYNSFPWFKRMIYALENTQQQKVVLEIKEGSLKHLSPKEKHILKRLKYVSKSIKVEK